MILRCIKDNDESIKRRAMELAYVIVNKTNVTTIVDEMTNGLLVEDKMF